MTDAEKTALVGVLINDSTVSEEQIAVYLSLAGNKILERCYPMGSTAGKTVPRSYENLQCELAARYIFRRGIEGQNVSIDNGVHRHFDSVNDEDLLKEVMQVVSFR